MSNDTRAKNLYSQLFPMLCYSESEHFRVATHTYGRRVVRYMRECLALPFSVCCPMQFMVKHGTLIEDYARRVSSVPTASCSPIFTC